MPPNCCTKNLTPVLTYHGLFCIRSLSMKFLGIADPLALTDRRVNFFLHKKWVERKYPSDCYKLFVHRNGQKKKLEGKTSWTCIDKKPNYLSNQPHDLQLQLHLYSACDIPSRSGWLILPASARKAKKHKNFYSNSSERWNEVCQHSQNGS